MNRRRFLKNSSLASVALSAVAQASCNNTGDQAKKQLPVDGGNVPAGFPLDEISIDALQQKMKNGSYTSRAVTELYLKRINEIDRNGIRLHAVIEINPDALAIADEMDKERKAGKLRGPLHGIPVLIKDNIDTGDQMMTTAGSIALEGHRAASDAFVVKQLRAAGAVLLGKTNLSEWANFRSTRSTSGWSSRGGQTKNPCMLDRNPSGSSSGSAAAVAANLCTVAVGTETDGSIIAPSSFCGIVGLKPTVGLISRSGIIPISKTQDTAGPMARTVRDVAVLLGALTGFDAKDEVTSESNGRSQKDYTSFLTEGGLRGKRLGIEKSFFQGHEGVVGLYREAIGTLKKLGASIVEVELLKAFKGFGTAELTILQHEFKDGLNRYLAVANAKVKSLADVIAFNKQNEPRAMPYFKQEILEICEATKGLDSEAYTRALQQTTGSRKIIDDLMKASQLDAICGTSIGLACSIDLVNGDYDTGFYFCAPAAMAGYPHITVPMGTVHDLPAGLSFISGAYTEPGLLNMAYAFEQASKKRIPPKFIKTSIPS